MGPLIMLVRIQETIDWTNHGKFFGTSLVASFIEPVSVSTFATFDIARIQVGISDNVLGNLLAALKVVPTAFPIHSPDNISRRNHQTSGQTCWILRSILAPHVTSIHNTVSFAISQKIASRVEFISALEKSEDTFIHSFANHLAICSDHHSNRYLVI